MYEYCPYFLISKTQRRTIDVLSEKRKAESRILKMRPAGDQANRAQSQREKKPHDPHNIISLPDHTNDNQHPHNLIADGASGPTG